MKRIHIIDKTNRLDITALVDVKVGKDGYLRVYNMRGDDVTDAIIFGIE